MTGPCRAAPGIRSVAHSPTSKMGDKYGVNLQVLPGAGVANVRAVSEGKADIRLRKLDLHGRWPLPVAAPFENPQENVCNVATLYPQYFQIVALADAGIDIDRRFRGQVRGDPAARQHGASS